MTKIHDRRLLSITELSIQLGVKHKTVYGWVNQRKLPFIKMGRLVRFDPVDIDEWVRTRKVEVFQ